MKIQVRNSSHETGFGIEVDPAKPPTVVPSTPDRPALTLNWERALDDQRRLRHCPVCGCTDLFVRKQFPQLTAFVLLILAAVVAMVLYGFGLVMVAVIVLVVLALVDLCIFFFAARVLECYRCHSIFRKTSIRPGHPRWDPVVAQRYRDAEGKPA